MILLFTRWWYWTLSLIKQLVIGLSFTPFSTTLLTPNTCIAIENNLNPVYDPHILITFLQIYPKINICRHLLINTSGISRQTHKYFPKKKTKILCLHVSGQVAWAHNLGQPLTREWEQSKCQMASHLLRRAALVLSAHEAHVKQIHIYIPP